VVKKEFFVSTYPQVIIRPKKITANTLKVMSWLKPYNIDMCGVTKVTCAHPAVVKALLDAGVREIGDSRLENLVRARPLVGKDYPLMLLRLPMISEAEEVVAHSDSCLVSEKSTISALSAAAVKQKKHYDVILMIDMGDLREGVWEDQAADLAAFAIKAKNIRLRGIGTNLACFSGAAPTRETLEKFGRLGLEISRQFKIKNPVLSGGNSSCLPILLKQGMPAGINHFRLGESLLLGVNVLDRTPLADLDIEAFELKAEILEIQRKPSVPKGTIAQNAFGERPQFKDNGVHGRAILAIGRQDIQIRGLIPLMEGVEVLGASSDHLIVDVEAVAHKLKVGDTLSFRPSYAGLLAACTSEYVKKTVVDE
jgi:predicted amino acid racemase